MSSSLVFSTVGLPLIEEVNELNIFAVELIVENSDEADCSRAGTTGDGTGVVDAGSFCISAIGAGSAIGAIGAASAGRSLSVTCRSLARRFSRLARMR